MFAVTDNDRAHTDRIVWIDCEMTGLDLENDALIEVAALVTDFELNQLGDGVDVVIKPEPAALEQMGDFVRDMPQLAGHLHYRTIDVSSIKELSRRWYPRAYFNAPAKHGGHRALADIRESIAELRYYREAVFVPAPGPTSNEAQVLAKRYEVGP